LNVYKNRIVPVCSEEVHRFSAVPGYANGMPQSFQETSENQLVDVVIFGQKDFQQLRILTAMTEALNLPIQIVGGRTVRESDNLAMSSRNQYLSASDREKATSISRGLFAAEAEFNEGVKQTNRLITTIQHILLEQHLSIDYIAAVDPITLKNVDVINGPTVLAVAARVGTTRLIDNVVIG